MAGSAGGQRALAPQPAAGSSVCARSVEVRGIVQGVGFRPYLFRLARRHAVSGWVRNSDEGVQLHIEGSRPALDGFLNDLRSEAPPAARIADVHVAAAEPAGLSGFEIRESRPAGLPTARISPDLPVCEPCLRELFDPGDRRHGYAYINCTDCGPRFSIVHGLPYDRPRTTMASWRMCEACARQYETADDRRFHAQPIACPACGPHYSLTEVDSPQRRRPGQARGEAAIREAARLLREGRIVAIKGIGGYHLACDAANSTAVEALRGRKFRKEKPFALMVPDLEAARAIVDLTSAAEVALMDPVRPIVLAAARRAFPGVAPGNRDLGVMLPYAPLHHLLFACRAPAPMVMTSGNRSSEPIAYEDEDARVRLEGLADAFLTGERPIARRLDDSIVRVGERGPVVLRRSRGLAPAAVAELPACGPILAVGGDLKNSLTLVIDGQAYVGPHIGDLEHYDALRASRKMAADLLEMYEVSADDLLVVHDLHPQYASTAHALTIPAKARVAVQHHRAHVASVLAERGALEARVLGISFDGTGYGDDGSIWGGEFFVGSVREGLVRAACLRPVMLPGGDAAARHPVQSAAGFLSAIETDADFGAPPFSFPPRYADARQLVARGVRVFRTSSAGRLFDAVAALLGFTREISFEGQAAIWLEQLAGDSTTPVCCPFGFDGAELDWRPALDWLIEARRRSADPAAIAAGFHQGLALGIAAAAETLLERHGLNTIVLSGGVFQNELLLSQIGRALGPTRPRVWTNSNVPPNDGGLSLGQAALAAFHPQAGPPCR